MKKILMILCLCVLMLSGCQQNISKIEVTKLDSIHDSYVVDEEKFSDFETLVQDLSFGQESTKGIDESYYGLYITKGNTIHSYYIYEDGTIEYEKNNDKKAPQSVKNKDVAVQLIHLINSIN